MLQSLRKLRSAVPIAFPLVVVAVAGVALGDAGPPAPAVHAELACTECHGFTRSGRAAATDPDGADRSCRSCHVLQKASHSASGHAFHDEADRSCLDCHLFHDVRSIKALDYRLSIDFGRASLQAICKSCHLPGEPPTARHDREGLAMDFFHSGHPELETLSPSEACLVCHSSDSPSLTLAQPSSHAPQFRAHSSHPFGKVVHPGGKSSAMPVRQDIDSRILLFDRRIECQTCHRAGGSGEDLLVQFERREALCLGCHRKAGGGEIAYMPGVAQELPDRSPIAAAQTW